MDISVNEINSVKESPVNDSDCDICIIMRQTTYTREEATKLLSELGSIEKCIKHYLGI